MAEISKAEKTELRRVVKGRIALIQEQIGHRELVLRTAVTNQLKAESQKTIDAFTKRAEKLIAEATRIKKEANELVKQYEGQVEFRYRNSTLLDFNNNLEDIRPYQIDTRVMERVQEVREQGGFSKLNLKALELELLEELSIDSIGSDQAKKFLAKIPSLDSILPLPEEIKALAKGNNE